MRGTFKAEDQVTGAPTQINVEDFNLMEDYRNTSSFDCTSVVSTTILMSANGWTIVDDCSQPKINTLMSQNMMNIRQCESPYSLDLSLQWMTISTHDYNRVLSLPVQQPMTKVVHLKSRSRTDIPRRAYWQMPFHNCEKGNKNSDKGTRSASSFSSTSNYDSDNNVPLSTTSCMSDTYLTPYNEVLPVLQLPKYPVEIAFRDMSCVISKRPDRQGVQETTQPLLSAHNSRSNLPQNIQRKVPNTTKELPESAVLEIEAPY